MAANQCEFPLQNAILENDLDLFHDLILNSNVDVNQRDKDGNTPLIFCVKRYRPATFVELLLKNGCDVLICDGDNMSPLYLSLIYCTIDITRLLLTYKREVYCTDQKGISTHLFLLMKNRHWKFQIIFLEQVQNAVICSYCSENHGSFKVEIHEINTFLLDPKIDTKLFKNLSKQFLNRSFQDSDATIFKCVWNQLSKLSIWKGFGEYTIRTFVYSNYSFSNSEFAECLRLILSSPNIKEFFWRCTSVREYTRIFYKNILCTLGIRKVELQDRISILLCMVKIAKVTIDVIKVAYDLYGFKEEVVILIQNLKIGHFSKCNHEFSELACHFIRRLNQDPCLPFDKINDLGLVPKQSYRKIINLLPYYHFSDERDGSIRAKKRLLNRKPTLYELSTFHSQKYIQKFYNIQTPEEFCKIVRNLTLPNLIKNSLCKNPPVYYEL